MKTIMLLTLFIGVYPRAYCQDFKPSNNSYVEIRPTGDSQINIPSIFIGLKTIHFPLLRNDTVGLHFNGNVTPEWIDKFLAYQYQNIVTDDKTYNVLISFLNDKSQQKFYTKTLDENKGDPDDYEITVEGKKYHVYYKYLHFFFTILVYRLSNQKCDPVVIEKLKFYKIERDR